MSEESLDSLSSFAPMVKSAKSVMGRYALIYAILFGIAGIFNDIPGVGVILIILGILGCICVLGYVALCFICAAAQKELADMQDN